jgi:hypothetical protein
MKSRRQKSKNEPQNCQHPTQAIYSKLYTEWHFLQWQSGVRLGKNKICLNIAKKWGLYPPFVKNSLKTINNFISVIPPHLRGGAGL